jgi:hypothetical protein
MLRIKPSAIHRKGSEELNKQKPSQHCSERRDRVRIMPLGANAASRAVDNSAAARGLII